MRRLEVLWFAISVRSPQPLRLRLWRCQGERQIRLLLVTSEWPSAESPGDVPFLVEQVASLRKHGCAIEVFPFQGRKNPLRYKQARRRVSQLLREKEFDLVHAHFGQSGLAAVQGKTPLVLTLHGSDLEGLRGRTGRRTPTGRILRRVSRWAARRAARVILVAERLGRQLPNDVEFTVIPCAVDVARFRPMPSAQAKELLGLPLDRDLVLFPSAPANPIKRFSLAQNSVDVLAERRPAELVVMNGVPHQQVPIWLSACDALVLTSTHEGSPTVVKEALASGLPIVSTDVGDVAERVRGVEGCEVCDSAADALALALGRVLDRRQRVEAASRVADLDHSAITPRILEVYDAALLSGTSRT